MLDMKKTQDITDIIHTSIPYSGIEHAVISTPIYNRLHRILQSSLVFLTYPSNKVKRFEHSVGTMHLSGEIFFNSICNATDEVLSDFMNRISAELIQWRKEISFDKYSFVSNELRNKYKDKEILKASVPESSFYNKYYPKNLNPNQTFAFLVALQAVRLAGLLHDVGHLPYSHILEHAFKRMYLQIKDKESKTEIDNYFLTNMHRFADKKDEIHEEIGKLLVVNIKNSIIPNIVDKTDPDIYFFLASFDFAEKIICSSHSNNNIFSDLHFITSSVLDADRLDYCSRDAFCSGLNKSPIEYDRLLSSYSLRKITEDKESRFYFCPSSKSITTIEDILRRRKTIFSEINFHHRVHKHEALLEDVISLLGIEELNNMNKISDLKELPNTLPLNISSIWQLISKLDSSNDWPEYQIIQLDDSWLDTLLKHKFFEKYGSDYLSLRKNGEDSLWNKFDELISVTKRYHSFFKRVSDFKEFDKLFFTKLKDLGSIATSIHPKILTASSYEDFFNSHRSFIFNYCVETLYGTDAQKDDFFNNFEKEINKLVDGNKFSVNDCMLRSCMFGFGYKTAKTPLFVSNGEKDGTRIEQVSCQLETFQNERAISPIFHLYYLPVYIKNYNDYSCVDVDKFLDAIATAAFNVISALNIRTSLKFMIDKQNTVEKK